jgi:Uma2 family endonuclease
VAVVRGDLRAYTAAHPADPVLVVEIALSSLALDREHKASLYARAGRPEYWILNLMERVLEVYRDPVPSQNASYGWDYRARETFGAGDSVRPLAAPTARVVVGDLLP